MVIGNGGGGDESLNSADELANETKMKMLGTYDNNLDLQSG